MPLKAVIVEDNPATIRSLMQTINWQSLDCTVVGTANNGESGLKLILRESPDIVLTDIRMPRKDGLDMIEEVHKELPDCKVIIITGYDQFQYASRAIKLSVFDYILKPIDNKEIERSIHRAAAMARRKQETDVVLEQSAMLNRRVQLLNLLTNDSQRGQGVRGLLSNAGLDFSTYYIILIQLQDERVFAPAAFNRVDSVLERKGVDAVTLFLYDAIVIFVFAEDPKNDWRNEAESIAEAVNTELVTPVRIGISKLGSSRHAIRQIYQQARQALWEIALCKNPCVSNFYQDDEERRPNERIIDLYHKIDELLEKADLSDESAIEAAEVIAEQSGKQYSNLRAMVTLYAMSLRKKFPCPFDEKIHGPLFETWFVTSTQDVRNCLIRLCTVMREAIQAREGAQQSLLTRNALQFIRLHAVEGLSLNDVAEKLCISANYLSALIRKETGVTFHEHVLTAKMQIARTMLADPRNLVSDVASAVGYGNYISFYNAFKRVDHITPTEYRNQKVGQ
ncbi:MAG: response regulator [Bacillota bacterium]